MMARHFLLLMFVGGFTGTLAAQGSVMRHKFELDGVGILPVSGYKAEEYSAGPGLRVGYELRLQKHIAADVGWTAAWLPGTSCSRFGCAYPRFQNRLADYGLRGVIPLAQGRIELSVGIGGGHIWFDQSSGDSPYYNSSLLQYSAKTTVAIDRRGRFRMDACIRAWRDVGRPTQQWISTSAGISYGFSRMR